MDGTGDCGCDDEAVFVALYARLRRFAGVVRPLHVDADDLVQEALARTLSSRRLSELEWPEAYLRQAILRVAMNEHRRWRRHDLALPGWVRSRERSVDSYPSDLADVMRVSPRVRAVLYLHIVEDMPYEAVAAALRCRPEAARKAGSRGLRDLRAVVDVGEGDGL